MLPFVTMHCAPALSNMQIAFCGWPGGSSPAQGAGHIDQENIMQTTDFIIHIDEALNVEALESVENDIRKSRGVMSAGHRLDRPHLVQVVYDSDSVRMSEIVEEVRGHGLHAQAVGL
jgi:hypothetical protein